MLETEIKTYLQKKQIRFTDSTASHSEIDFLLPELRIALDAKEKTQPFAMKNWGNVPILQENLFIIDDLAARKLLLHAPLSFVLIKDSSSDHAAYFVYSIVDLLCIPKRRVNRPIERIVKALKGKWLLDLRDAAIFDELSDALEYIIKYKSKFPRIFSKHISCWGKYPSEEVLESGATRKTRYWDFDSRAHK